MDQPDQVMVSSSSQEREGDGLEPRDQCFPKGRISKPTQVFLNQEFQAQLVDINKELTKFDGKDKEGEENAAERPCTTNSKVLESAIYLNNLFTQTNPKRQPPLNNKFTQVVRKINGVERLLERREQVFTKCARRIPMMQIGS